MQVNWRSGVEVLVVVLDRLYSVESSVGHTQLFEVRLVLLGIVRQVRAGNAAIINRLPTIENRGYQLTVPLILLSRI